MLSRQSAAQALVATPIVCAPNTNISSSGCGNTGAGNSGFGNAGTANSGDGNTGTGNSGDLNVGTANSGDGNTGTGNSGCGNAGTANSGGANVGVALSGGSLCPIPVVVTTVTTVKPGTTTTTVKGTTTTVKAPTPSPVTVKTLAATGSNTSGPLTLALGLMLSGGLAVGMANRKRHALAAATGGEVVALSTAVGLLLTGRARTAEPQDRAGS